MRRPPPRLHRRLEGHVGPARRLCRRSSPAAAASSARRPGGWRATAPARSCSSVASTASCEPIREPRGEVARVIRRLRPEVVLGHDPWKRYRLHPDHRHAGFLVCDAIVAARDPHFFPEHGLDPHRPAALLLWEADEPNHVEDVAAGVERKLAALEAHESQFESTMHAADERELDAFRQRIRARLAELGAPHGLRRRRGLRPVIDL